MPRTRRSLKNKSNTVRSDDDLRELLQSMSKADLIEMIMKNPGQVTTSAAPEAMTAQARPLTESMMAREMMAQPMTVQTRPLTEAMMARSRPLTEAMAAEAMAAEPMAAEAMAAEPMAAEPAAKTMAAKTMAAKAIATQVAEDNMPLKLDGSVFGFFDEHSKTIYPKLYEGYVDESRYPDEQTCLEVKRLCTLDPMYCIRYKFKEKYHNLCKEIKSTLSMIRRLVQKNNELERMGSGSSFSSSGSKDIYEIDEYLELVNGNKYSGKKKFDVEVIECLSRHIDDVFGDSRRARIYSSGGEDLSWSDLERLLMDFGGDMESSENNLEKFMHDFGIKLHNRNPERYYPLIVEKIKQKILREYFM